MNRVFFLFLSSFLLATTCLQAQVILSPDRRSNLLDGVEGVIGNTSRPVYSLAEDETLFYEIRRAEPVNTLATTKESTSETTEESVIAAPVTLSDDTALGIISSQFKPLGSMIFGSRGLLQLPKGKTIEQGQTFTAEIKGISYEVMISEVTEKGYVLQLGTARLERSFIK